MAVGIKASRRPPVLLEETGITVTTWAFTLLVVLPCFYTLLGTRLEISPLIAQTREILRARTHE